MAPNEKVSYYRAISYVDDEHRRVAGHTNTDADAAAVHRGAVVTEMAPTGPFCETVPEHRDCLRATPAGSSVRTGSRRNPAQEVPHR